MKRLRRRISAILSAAAGLAVLASAAPAQDARWNALYDRIIRLEHQVKTLRELPGKGGRVDGRRLRAIERQISELRREMSRRLTDIEARLAKLEGRKAPTPANRSPGTATIPQAPMPPVANSDLRGPEYNVEIEPPREQLLGRITVDEKGRPKPPRMVAPPPRTPGGARPLPGVPMTLEPAPGVATPPPILPETVQTAPLDTPGTTKTATADGDPELVLKGARDNFLARRYGLAESAYRAFLQRFPSHPKAAQARYELGETYYVQGRYKDAGQAYIRTYKDWPRSSVAPQALYRLGLSLRRLGRTKEACRTWKLLREKYPQSRAARTSAPREMKRARCG